MLYGTPTRAAHRATVGGGLALLANSAGTIGQHRPPPPVTGTHARPRLQRRAPREPQHTAQCLARGLASVIVLGLAVMIGFLILVEDRPGPRAAAGPEADVLDSRAVDPSPLSLQEVFGESGEVRVAGARYRITVRHADSDCRIATTGLLGQVLHEHGCNQVVRAALTAPYGDYEVTAGVVNLADAGGAADVDGRLRRLVETDDGSFAAMATSRPDPSALPTAQVGWHAQGHYLLYCVITRPGGRLVAGDDPYAGRITAELVDTYLGEAVLGRRQSSA
jgi:hypothetical protein